MHHFCRRGDDHPAPMYPVWNSYAGEWMAPFVMEQVNGRIVHRSAALAKNPNYGAGFKYQEGMGVGNVLMAGAIAGGMATAAAALSVPPLRKLARRCVAS